MDMFSTDNLNAPFENASFQTKLKETMADTVDSGAGAAVARHLPAAVQPLLQLHQQAMDKKLEDAIGPLQASIEQTNETILKLQQKLDETDLDKIR